MDFYPTINYIKCTLWTPPLTLDFVNKSTCGCPNFRRFGGPQVLCRMSLDIFSKQLKKKKKRKGNCCEISDDQLSPSRPISKNLLNNKNLKEKK